MSNTWFRVFAGCCVLIAVFMLKGCGSAPQMSAPNRKILEALQTAVSSKQRDWLDAVATQIEEKRKQNEISSSEFTVIDAIIKKAKSGDWKGAQKDSFALSEGQRPTAADLSMLKDRKRAHESEKK